MLAFKREILIEVGKRREMDRVMAEIKAEQDECDKQYKKEIQQQTRTNG